MFLIRPQPLQCESLSSWRQRAGIANGFSQFPRPVGTHRFQDVDRFLSTSELSWVLDSFRVDETVIKALSLEVIGSNISKNFGESNRPHWVVPIGTRATGSGSGYCPKCLAEDKTPYFRLAWRFAFVVTCPVHQCALLDCCPTCDNAVWPSSFSSTRQRFIDSLSVCPSCGNLLTSAYFRHQDCFTASLWHCAVLNKVPSEIPQAASSVEVFTGLRALCQLLLRKQGAKVLRVLPFGRINEQNKLSTIELMPMRERATVIGAAYYLLQGWPHRFLEVMKQCGISRYHLTIYNSQVPKWLSDVVNNDLAIRTRGISHQQVHDAIRDIENSGKRVSKSAVRRALKVTEATALNELLSQRRKGTWRELMILCSKFEKQLLDSPTSRSQKSTLLRDYLLFLITVLSGRTIEDTCKMTRKNVDATLLIANPDNNYHMVLASRARELNRSYLSKERLELNPTTESQGKWFVSRYGGMLAGHTVRERIAKMMRSGFPKNLWNSADVFIGVLDELESSHLLHIRQKGTE